MTKEPKGTRAIQLLLPPDLYDALSEEADGQCRTVEQQALFAIKNRHASATQQVVVLSAPQPARPDNVYPWQFARPWATACDSVAHQAV